MVLFISGSSFNFRNQIIINLHNGKVFASGSVSLNGSKNTITNGAGKVKDILNSTIDNTYKLGSTSKLKVVSLVKQIGASCSAGYLINKPENISSEESTDGFLKGLAVTVSGGALVKLGVTAPAGDWWKINGMKGIEIGIGTPGAGIDISNGEETEKFTLFEVISRK